MPPGQVQAAGLEMHGIRTSERQEKANTREANCLPFLSMTDWSKAEWPWNPWWLSWWRNSLQCRRPQFYPWAGKTPSRRDRLPTLVFWPGEFHGLYSPWGHKVSDTTEWLTFRVVVKYPCPAAPPRTEWPLLLCAEAVVTQWHTPLYRFPTFPAWFISPTHSCCPEIAWSTSPHAQQSVSTSVTDSCSAS